MRPNETYAFDLIVVGGGPAGSTAAAIAARAGLRVLLLEAGSHPRVHVGESLLPGIIPILEQMGVLGDVEAAGFTRKTGSTHWGWGRTPEWDLWFTDSEAYDHAWLVDRSRFDELLFRGAARAGAEAHENAAVKGFLREGDRVVGVTYRRRGSEALVEARAPFTLDASGAAALTARELELRTMLTGLQHEAAWAHFEGAGRLPPPREGQALFVATEGQWMWHFPLSEARTSVGLIRLADDEGATEATRVAAFDRAVAGCARLRDVLGPGARRVGPVHTQRDWSYRMSRVCGPGWLLAGDASGFIDPVLSTGVLLAMHAAFHAARLVRDVLRGEAAEADALARYQAQHAALFEDLLRMVRFFYRQNLHRDDYFWESKRILVDELPALRPRKAFMVLTSGLVRNLAYDEKSAEASARRGAELEESDAPSVAAHDPAELGFVCIHLRHERGPETVALYVLVEPADPAAPTLFSTRNWHVNALAPKLGNDPISDPALAPLLRRLEAEVRRLDTTPGETLASFWRRARGELMAAAQGLGPEVHVVRVFGE
jgi:flavin-dependent dehydrogenase